MSGSPRSSTTRSARLLPHRIQRRLAGRGLDHHVALAAKTGAQEAQDRRFVIDHEDAERAGACGHSNGLFQPARRRPDTGSVMVNTAPERSVRLVAVMVPCIASTKPRQIARPSPVPARRRSAPPTR